MKGFRIFLATFAITLTIGALAQDSVTPSRPRFLSVGVGVQAPSTNGDLRVSRIGVNTAPAGAAGTVTATSFSGAHTGDGSALTSLNASNISSGTLADGRTSSNVAKYNDSTPTWSGSPFIPSQINFNTGISGFHEFVNRNASARGYNWYTGASGTGLTMTLSTGGVLNTTGGFTVAGSPVVPTHAIGIMSGIGSCSVSTGSIRISSCTRASAGVYNVNFSVSLGSNNPVCTATVNNSAGAVRSITVQTFNATRKDVRIVDGAGSATDANFELICFAT